MFWLLISATPCWNSSSINLQEIYVGKVLFSQKSPAWQSKRMVSLLKYPLTCREGTIVMPLDILSSRGRLCVHLVSLWWVGRGLVIVQATREPSSVRWLWTGLQSRVIGREGGMGRTGLPLVQIFHNYTTKNNSSASPQNSSVTAYCHCIPIKLYNSW